MIPDYALDARARWDRYNMTTASTRLPNETIDAFDKVCEAAGVSRYEAIRHFCVACTMRPETLTGLRWRRARRKGK